ncbi:unnamed protein product, partial [marine sediment metagenome]
MLQPLLDLGRAGSIGAIIHDLTLRLNHLSLAFRACRALFLFIKNLLLERKFLFFATAFTYYRTHYLRYHLTRP